MAEVADGGLPGPVATVTPLLGRRGLVGRHAELAAIEDAWERVRAGPGATVIVSGPPGIGKTSLVTEFGRRQDTGGHTMLRAQCSPDPDAPELWPWVQILRQGMLLVPTLELPDAQASEFSVCDATVSLLRAAADDRPVAVVIDDAHWADPASLRLLEVVCRSGVDMAVLVVVAHRDLEPAIDGDAATMLARIARYGTRVPLGGFTEAETALLMASRAGNGPAAGLVREVHAVTGGNPLFIDEAVRLLASGDNLAALDGLPATLVGTAGRALATLADPERAALQVAAVAGTEFSDGVLAAALGETREQMQALLGRAGERGFIHPATADGGWAFSNALIRDAALGSLDGAATAELHRRVGQAMRDGWTATPVDPAKIAEHFVAAARHGPVGPAVACCRTAAEDATTHRAHDDAVRWLEEAVRLAYRDTATPDDGRFELLLSLGEAQTRAGCAGSAASTFERARRLADNRGATVGIARAVLGAVEARRRGPGWDTALDDVAVLLERAADALDPGSHPSLVARLLAEQASVHALAFEPAAAQECAIQAAALAESCGDLEAGHAAVVAGRWAALGPAPLSVKTALTDQLVLNAAQTGDDTQGWVAQRWRLDDGLAAGDPDVVNGAVSMSMALAERLDEPELRCQTLLYQATVAMMEGRFDDARSLHSRARQQAATWEVPEEAILGHELYMSWELGELDIALVRAFAEALPRPLGRALLCWTAMIGDDIDTARTEVTQFFDDVPFEDLPDGNYLPAILVMLAEAAARTDMVECAEIIRRRLTPFADQCAIAGTKARVWAGSNHLYIGMLSTVLGDHADAARHLEAAEQVHRRMGARCHLVRGQIWRARLAIRRGDEASARVMLESALRQARALGLSAAVADAERDLETMKGAAPTPGRCTLRRDGAAWSVSAGAHSHRLRHRKGLDYLHSLLERPGQEVHVLDLVGASGLRGDAGVGPTLDAAAKAAYRRRVEDLRDQIDEGERWGDPARVARAQDELDAIARELATSVGLGGRDRPSDAGERARVSVTKAIRSAIDDITEAAPALGTHLAAAVRTGYYCTYEPDPAAPVTWDT